MSNPIQVIEGDILAIQTTFEQVNADPRQIEFRREAEFALQTLSRNDYALSVAMKNRQSVQDAITNVAAIGISLNPAKKQAYLVPRDGRICLDISYMGLMDLAVNSGAIKWVKADVVRANDEFVLHGIDRPPEHKFSPFAKLDVRGEIVGAYAAVKTPDGDILTHTMDIDAIFAIRDRSSAWKAWVEKKRKCPWVTDEIEMIRKTVVKQASKYWPRPDNERLSAAIEHVNTELGEGLAEFNSTPTGFDLAGAQGRIAACESVEELRKLREELLAEVRAAKDKEAYRAIDRATRDRKAELDGVTDVDPKEPAHA